MGRLLRKPQSRDLLLGAMLVLAALALVLWPREAMESVKAGLKLCGNVIVPSLFPFFVLSSLVVELGMSRYLGRLMQPLMVPLFRVNGACASALALGVIGGYPVGARTAIALYESGQCSRTEAERLLAFCNNSGPAFILGVVGAGVFGSGTMGLLLYLTHILASLCVGLLFRFYRPGEGPRSHRERGGPVSDRPLLPGLHPFGHRGGPVQPEHLRLCTAVCRGHPVADSGGDSGPAGGGAGGTVLPPGLYPGVGPAATHRPAGNFLRGVLPVRGLPHRADVHGRLHAGVGGAVRPLPGALLSGGQRPVHGHLLCGKTAPRTLPPPFFPV